MAPSSPSMADQAPTLCTPRCAWLGLLAVTFAMPAVLVASWTVDSSVVAAHVGGPKSYTFATQAEAQAFMNANQGYNLKLVAGGSDNGSSAGGATIPGVAGLPGPGLNAQQQLALAAAQAALPLVQQTLRNIFSGPAQHTMPAPSQNQSAIAAQQLYNTGLWYLRHNDYANAQIEFEKALGRDHGNRAILNSLEEAKRKMAQAQQAALQATPPATPVPPAKLMAAPSALNFINLNNDPSVVDLRRLPPPAANQATTNGSTGQIPAQSAGPAPSANPSNLSSLAQLQQQSLNADFDQIFSDPAGKGLSPK
jgi:hypothetical protein